MALIQKPTRSVLVSPCTSLNVETARFDARALLKRQGWGSLLAAIIFIELLLANTAAFAGAAGDSRRYKLEPGDRIAVTVFGHTDLSGDFLVDGSGSVQLPLIETLEAKGLTIVEFQQRVTAALEDGILQRAVVNVSIAEFRPVSVMGDVRTPGVYPFRSGNLVKGAIAQAGGYGVAEQFPGSAASELLAAEERLSVLTDERRLLAIRQARIEAQLAQAKSFVPPLSEEEAKDPEVIKLVKQETQVFSDDTAAFEKQINTIVSQKPQFLSESEAIDGQIASGEKQLEIVRKQMKDYNQLLDKGLGRSNAMVEIQLAEANILTNNYRLKADQFRVRNQVVSLDIQVVEYENVYKRRLQGELQTLIQRLRQIDVTLPSVMQTRDLRAQLTGRVADGTIRIITITRRSNGEVKSFEAEETTLLEPGDIIDIKNVNQNPRMKAATNGVPAGSQQTQVTSVSELGSQ
jgi:polysaccharide export outer membrane protein